MSEWSRKRARASASRRTPPSLNDDGTVTVSSRMGRIDFPEGRRQAEIDAAEAAKVKAAEEKKALALAKEQEKKAAELAKAQAAEPVLATGTVPPPAEVQTEPSGGSALGLFGTARKKIVNIFGS